MKIRFLLFVIFLTTVLLSSCMYVGTRLAASGLLSWTLVGAPFFFVWALPTFYWSSDSDGSSRWSIVFQWLSFLSMGFLSFLVPLALVRDFLFFPFVAWFAPLSIASFESASNQGILALSVTFLTWGIRQAFKGPIVQEVTIPVPKLQGFTIAQISDLHVGPTIGRNYVERVVKLVNSLNPTAIVITGDLIDGTVKHLRPQVAPLQDLKASQGTYYITGNHEHYWEAQEWVSEMKRLGATPLINTSIQLTHQKNKISISGIDDHYPDFDQAKNGLPEDAFKILLAHQPKHAPTAARQGFDFQISGHTHGGQFPPWTWVARKFHRYFLGLDRCEQMWIYVSPGTGSWGPPVRLWTRPEVTLIRFS